MTGTGLECWRPLLPCYEGAGVDVGVDGVDVDVDIDVELASCFYVTGKGIGQPTHAIISRQRSLFCKS